MNALEFRGVSFSYEENGPLAVDDLNFTVQEGDFVAVLGHNGSGKSTLARLSGGLLTADKGEIACFSNVLSDKNLYDIRKNLGIVFQNPDSQAVASLVEDDVAFGPENLGLPRDEIGRRIDFALRATGMEDFRGAMISRLSGGQKQRVAIAGVLAMKPKIMILDEATAMLDPKGRREIVEVVKELNKREGITVVMITHFMEEALQTDRALVMNRGSIAMQGSPEEIFERHEELLSFGLALPRIGVILKKLREGGMELHEVLGADALAKEIVSCVS